METPRDKIADLCFGFDYMQENHNVYLWDYTLNNFHGPVTVYFDLNFRRHIIRELEDAKM